MALIYIDDSDPWLNEYEACDSLRREIMEQMTLRDQEPRTSQAFVNLSANIRLRLKQYTHQVQQLKNRVSDAVRQRKITVEEAERRMRQVEFLESKDKQIKRLYEFKTNDLAISRASLMGQGSASAFADGGTVGWGDDDENIPRIDPTVSVADLKTQQEEIIQRQDEGLEELSKILSRQKHIAHTIHNEVDQHNEIIDDLADHMDRVDNRLVDGAQNIRTVSQKDSVCSYWVVIILLFISIIVVAML